MKASIATMLILLFSFTSAFGQRFTEDSEITALRGGSDQFMAHVRDGDFVSAFDHARTLPLAIRDNSLDTLEEKATSQLAGIRDAYGEILEVQYIGYNALADFLLRFIYVVRYETGFVGWQLVYYRGESAWLLSIIRYNADAAALMDITFR